MPRAPRPTSAARPPGPRRRRPVRAVLGALAAVALLGVAACSGDDGGTAAPAGGGSHGGDAHGGDAHGGGADSSGMGSSMGARTVSVEEVAELGPGPEVGDAWTGLVGLNVCGRFLEPPTAVGPAGGAFATAGDGTFTLAPTADGDAGHAATVGRLAELAGVSLSTASLTLPATTQPAVLDLGPTGADSSDLPLAGATLRTGDRCGDLPAEVQVWVYDADAVDTGEGVLQVVTDPEEVPVVEDGMALVLALSPSSSLPTLPPSALTDGR